MDVDAKTEDLSQHPLASIILDLDADNEYYEEEPRETSNSKKGRADKSRAVLFDPKTIWDLVIKSDTKWTESRDSVEANLERLNALPPDKINGAEFDHYISLRENPHLFFSKSFLCLMDGTSPKVAQWFARPYDGAALGDDRWSAPETIPDAVMKMLQGRARAALAYLAVAETGIEPATQLTSDTVIPATNVSETWSEKKKEQHVRMIQNHSHEQREHLQKLANYQEGSTVGPYGCPVVPNEKWSPFRLIHDDLFDQQSEFIVPKEQYGWCAVNALVDDMKHPDDDSEETLTDERRALAITAVAQAPQQPPSPPPQSKPPPRKKVIELDVDEEEESHVMTPAEAKEDQRPLKEKWADASAKKKEQRTKEKEKEREREREKRSASPRSSPPRSHRSSRSSASSSSRKGTARDER